MAAVAPLDDVPVSNDYVQIGDVVFLEDDRFIGVSGVGGTEDANTAYAHTGDRLRSSGEFSSQTLFVVQSYGTWTNLASFKSVIEHRDAAPLPRRAA